MPDFEAQEYRTYIDLSRTRLQVSPALKRSPRAQHLQAAAAGG